LDGNRFKLHSGFRLSSSARKTKYGRKPSHWRACEFFSDENENASCSGAFVPASTDREAAGSPTALVSLKSPRTTRFPPDFLQPFFRPLFQRLVLVALLEQAVFADAATQDARWQISSDVESFVSRTTRCFDSAESNPGSRPGLPAMCQP